MHIRCSVAHNPYDVLLGEWRYAVFLTSLLRYVLTSHLFDLDSSVNLDFAQLLHHA